MKYIKVVLLIILLFVLGFFSYQYFFEFSLSILDTNGISLFGLVQDRINRLSIFSSAIGVLPLFYLLLQKITNISFIWKGLASIFIIIIFGIIFWRLRVFGLNSEFEQLSAYDLPNELKPTIDVSYLKFEVYVLMGFIVGTLVSILVFRDRSKSLLN
jgi:hypothetical protein